MEDTKFRFEFDRTLDFLVKNAPKAPLQESVYLAKRIRSLVRSEYYLKCTLAILSDTVIKLEGNGEIPKLLSDKYKDNKAVMSCLKQIQYCNAWVVCGLVSDAMEKLIEERNEECSRKET